MSQRLKVTLRDDAYMILRRLSCFSGQSMSAIISSFLDLSMRDMKVLADKFETISDERNALCLKHGHLFSQACEEVARKHCEDKESQALDEKRKKAGLRSPADSNLGNSPSVSEKELDSSFDDSIIDEDFDADDSLAEPINLNGVKFHV